MKYDIIGYTRDQLEKRVTPGKVAGDMEGVPQPLYDTQTFTSATTTSLTFFTTAAATGLWNTNMRQGGQLPNPDFFIVQFMTLDVIGLDPVVGVGTNDQDLNLVLFGPLAATGAPYGIFHYASKDYGPWPLSAFHGTGGVTGSAGGIAATGIPENANNSIPDGGVWIGGAITIPPLQAFSLDLRWAATVTLTTSPLYLRVGLWGTYYRSIH